MDSTSTTSPATAGTPRAPAAAGPRSGARSTARRRELGACAALMSPFFALLVVVFLIPVACAVWLSFFSDDEPGLGFGPERSALQVKVPLIRSSLVMVAMFTLIAALQLFTEPMLLSQSTPMVGSRFTPNMYVYDAAFTRNNYGLAAAASVILLAVTIALSYGVTRWSNRNAALQEAR